MEIQTVYVKPTSRGQRVWLEDTPNNPRLSTAGFKIGARYTRTISDGVITLILDAEGKLKVSGKKLPIIDISGKNIAGYSDNTELLVEYAPSIITIREAIFDAIHYTRASDMIEKEKSYHKKWEFIFNTSDQLGELFESMNPNK